jgi:tetratricopeptide (TPR) repeat protein
MKRYAVVGTLILALLGLLVLHVLSRATNVGQGADKKREQARATESKAAAALFEQAEQAAAEGEYGTALKHYIDLEQDRPKLATLQFKIAACHAALGNKKDAEKHLRKVLPGGEAYKSASAELVFQARTALQQLMLPDLNEEQQKDWKQALSLNQAGAELKQHEDEDLEIRIEHKLFAGPYLKAIKLLEKLTEGVPDYAPAHSLLGDNYERLSRFKPAAEEYRKVLDWGAKNKLPELEQQSQIRQRLHVCERRHEVDAELTKRIPGVWEVSYDTGEHTFAVCCQLELLPGGYVNRREGAGWRLDKDTYWKVVSKRLIVGGLVGMPTEWCNLGPLASGGIRFEGLTMEPVRTRYVRKGDLVSESPN